MWRSTIIADSGRAPSLAVAALVLLLAACGPSEVTVKGRFPPPLVEPLPLTLGVWYDADFREHQFSDAGEEKTSGSWEVATGEAQVEFWDTLLGGMFTRLVHLEQRPAKGQSAGVDGVLIPHVEELQYSLPTHTNMKVYEIWLRYRFELLSATGEPLGEWTMSSYGKTPTATLQSDQEAVNLAAVMALRDAGAHFITTWRSMPAAQDWLSRHGVASESAATEGSTTESVP